MSSGEFLSLHPSELKFPFELRKQSSCSMQLTNKTDKYIAFKVKTTNPKKYCVRPNTGIVMPGSSCSVTVTMQAQKEAPPDMQCRDKFLLQSVVAPDGTTSKEISSELFNKEDGKLVDEYKLRVVYIPANPPSPVPEGSEEENSPRASLHENGEILDDVSRSLDSSQLSSISKLTAEKSALTEQIKKLREELELLRKGQKNQAGGVPVLLVLLVALLGLIVGYYVKST